MMMKQILTDLEVYFEKYRENIIGHDQKFKSGDAEHQMLYTDWTASGRLYQPIEEIMLNKVAPWVANTHTDTSLSGATMTEAYHVAREIIKKHVNASEDDVLISCGTGMTGAMAKLQRILGLQISDRLRDANAVKGFKRPMVFISHMEHHSNHTSWLETIAETIVIPHTSEGLMDLEKLSLLLSKFPNREKIVSVTACSNVTGIENPVRKIAGIAHANNAVCFVDYACSAPYVKIDMHPNDTEYLDAVTFSPHKFLGGPGSSGILVFNKKLYNKSVPDIPGGGTVTFTDPWGNHLYKKDIEEREDGGTPGFLQAIRTALSIRLKEEMGEEQIKLREKEINALVFSSLEKIDEITILEGQHKDRLSIFALTVEGLHYDLVTCLLNDKFGIQARGGCSCAGTYGHYLMDIDDEKSELIRKESEDDCSMNRPGWVRISFHPTSSNAEVEKVCNALKAIVSNAEVWKKEYRRTPDGYVVKDKTLQTQINVHKWFE